MKINAKIIFKILIVLHCLIFQIACALTQTEASSSEEGAVKTNPTSIGNAAKLDSAPCKNKKENIYVYPANDGFPHSQGVSGKPAKYCDENDLFQKKPDLLKKDQTN